jgi:hypothetical protein
MNLMKKIHKKIRGGCQHESRTLIDVYIPYIIKNIQNTTSMNDLVHYLTTLQLLSRLNKCLYKTAKEHLESISNQFTGTLDRVTQQTTNTHYVFEFLGYLAGEHRMHDELTLSVDFLMSDNVRIATRSIISTNNYRVISLEMHRTKGNQKSVEYVYNMGRSRYEFMNNNVSIPDTNAPKKSLLSSNASLFVRLLRAHHVVVNHLFPLVEHIYSYRISENPGSIKQFETNGITMRVDNLVSTEIFDTNVRVFYR